MKLEVIRCEVQDGLLHIFYLVCCLALERLLALAKEHLQRHSHAIFGEEKQFTGVVTRKEASLILLRFTGINKYVEEQQYHSTKVLFFVVGNSICWTWGVNKFRKCKGAP